MRLAVTHSSTTAPALYARARACAVDFGLPYLPRNRQSLARLCREHTLDGLLVLSTDTLSLHVDGAEYAFHPNAAKLRFHALLQKRGDRMAEAMDLRPGDRVLDCTCGLGADATVAAHLVGPDGSVRALEKSPLLARLVRRGLASYTDGLEEMVEAMRRVEVVEADAAELLADLPTGSWDVVYFDPFFEETVETAKGLDLVRLLGHRTSLSAETLAQARRVARRRVVCKDRTPGPLLRALGFEPVSRAKRLCFGALPPAAN